MAQPNDEVTYSIAAISKLTGVSCHALRVWERRYGFPLPRRSVSGHRRYVGAEIPAIRRLAELARGGTSIGDLIAAHFAGRLPLEEVKPEAEAFEEASALVDRLMAGDMAGGDLLYEQLSARLDSLALVERIIEPDLIDIGERWFRGECAVSQEHLASAFLRGKLVGLIEGARRANGEPRHTIVVGTVQGDRHEGGVLILNFILESPGWRVLNACVDLPVTEYEGTIQTWHPDALGLSFVLSRNINKRFAELARIREVPVFVGGRSILNYQSLARRHGLIPVAGSIGTGFARFQEEFESWPKARSRPPATT